MTRCTASKELTASTAAPFSRRRVRAPANPIDDACARIYYTCVRTQDNPARGGALGRLLAHGPASAPAASQMPPGAASSTRPWLALGWLAAAQFMVFLDETVVNVALPSIKTALGYSQSGLAWVVDAYILVFGGLLLVGGRGADLFGRRRVFFAGMVVFALASLLDGLAQDRATLIAARALQGLGAALSTPAALALVSSLFRDPRERARALGLWGGLSGLGFVAGVLLGGVITDLASWRWVFLINVPIAFAALVVLAHVLVDVRPKARPPLDLPAAALATSGVLALVYALLGTDRHGWLSGRTLGLFGASALLVVAFVQLERRREAPLIPVPLRRARSMLIADVLQAVLAATLISSFFLLTLYIQQALGYSPLRTGLAYLPMALLLIGGSGLASHLIPSVGARRVASLGLLASAGGLVLLSGVDAGGTYLSGLLPGLLLIALGAGLSFVSLATAALERVPDDAAGVASAMLNSSAMLGGTIGLAALTAIATRRASDLVAAGSSPIVAEVKGFDRAFLIAACVATVGAAVGWAGNRRARR
jgi:EmrB/QacA subfamily drug resistance transporter